MGIFIAILRNCEAEDRHAFSDAFDGFVLQQISIQLQNVAVFLGENHFPSYSASIYTCGWLVKRSYQTTCGRSQSVQKPLFLGVFQGQTYTGATGVVNRIGLDPSVNERPC